MSGGEEKSYTLLAIAMAGVTTLLGFGLLALSGTPAIADFGLTLALGATLTLLLAALFFVGGNFSARYPSRKSE
jgi:predicted exporter